MKIVLWILQVLLAVAFAAHGILLLMPPAELLVEMNKTMSTNFRLFLGIAEVLAAIGLTLPGITRILPWLISAAALGVIIVMLSATGFHVYRNEISSAIITAILLLMATVVAYMRWKVYPIAAK